MKKAIKVLTIIAIVAIIGFSTASCNDAKEEAEKILQKARYLTADAAGNVYELVITEAAGRYAGQENDDYKLGIWTNGVEAKTSTGTVASVTNIQDGKKYGLKKQGDTTAFNVDVSDSWITSLPASIPIDSGNTPATVGDLVERGTLSNAETVVYSATWGSDNTAAKAVTDFGYVEGGNGSYGAISDAFSGTSIKINSGKVSITLGPVPSSFLESLEAPSSGVTVSPSSGVNILRQESPFFNSNGSYLLVCVKTATTNGTTGELDYAMLCYTDKAFTMNGTYVYNPDNSEDWKRTSVWNGISAKKGWNYYLTHVVYNTVTKTLTETFSVPEDSSKPPEGYNWTVMSIEKAEGLHPF